MRSKMTGTSIATTVRFALGLAGCAGKVFAFRDVACVGGSFLKTWTMCCLSISLCL